MVVLNLLIKQGRPFAFGASRNNYKLSKMIRGGMNQGISSWDMNQSGMLQNYFITKVSQPSYAPLHFLACLLSSKVRRDIAAKSILSFLDICNL